MPDVEIRLGGKVYGLRPAYGAMREIEARCQSSVKTLLQMLAKGEMHLSEMAVVVYHGLAEAGDTPSDYETVEKRLYENGADLPAVRDPIAAYLSELLYAPDSARKKAVGEWWTVNEEITSLMFSAPPMQSDGDPETYGDPLPESSGRSSKPSVKKPSKSDARAEAE